MVMSSLLMCSWVIVRMFFETPQIRYLPFRIHHANIEHFCTLYENFHSLRNNCTMFNREIVVETKTQTKTKTNKNGQWNFARKFSLFRVSKIGLFIRRKKQNDGGWRRRRRRRWIEWKLFFVVVFFSHKYHYCEHPMKSQMENGTTHSNTRNVELYIHHPYSNIVHGKYVSTCCSMGWYWFSWWANGVHQCEFQS